MTLKETDVEILEAICLLSIVDESREETGNVKVNQTKLNVCIFHCIISQLKLKRGPKRGVNISFLFVFLDVFSLSLDYTQNESPNKSCSSVVQDSVRFDVTRKNEMFEQSNPRKLILLKMMVTQHIFSVEMIMATQLTYSVEGQR